MTNKDIISGIENLNITTARNSMGCSENWYNFFYAMKQTFTIDEIKNMTDRECELLNKLASNIMDNLY